MAVHLKPLRPAHFIPLQPAHRFRYLQLIVSFFFITNCYSACKYTKYLNITKQKIRKIAETRQKTTNAPEKNHSSPRRLAVDVIISAKRYDGTVSPILSLKFPSIHLLPVMLHPRIQPPFFQIIFGKIPTVCFYKGLYLIVVCHPSLTQCITFTPDYPLMSFHCLGRFLFHYKKQFWPMAFLIIFNAYKSLIKTPTN